MSLKNHLRNLHTQFLMKQDQLVRAKVEGIIKDCENAAIGGKRSFRAKVSPDMIEKVARMLGECDANLRIGKDHIVIYW